MERRHTQVSSHCSMLMRGVTSRAGRAATPAHTDDDNNNGANHSDVENGGADGHGLTHSGGDDDKVMQTYGCPLVGARTAAPRLLTCTALLHAPSPVSLCLLQRGLRQRTRRRRWRLAIMMMVTLTLHNFPEGVAVAVSSMQSWNLGGVVAIAIAIHNIPEGTTTPKLIPIASAVAATLIDHLGGVVHWCQGLR